MENTQLNTIDTYQITLSETIVEILNPNTDQQRKDVLFCKALCLGALEIKNLNSDKEQLKGRVQLLEVQNQDLTNQNKDLKNQIDELNTKENKEKYVNQLKNEGSWLDTISLVAIFGLPMISKSNILVSLALIPPYLMARKGGLVETEKFLEIEKEYLANHPNCLKSEAYEHAKKQYELERSQYVVQDAMDL